MPPQTPTPRQDVQDAAPAHATQAAPAQASPEGAAMTQATQAHPAQVPATPES
jgi:hypothetical protein